MEITDSSISNHRPNLWDTKLESQVYTGYGWNDRQSSSMPRKYPSLDMTLKPAEAEAYGNSKWQRGILSWWTGPIDMRYVGLYGDSSTVRAASWFFRRISGR